MKPMIPEGDRRLTLTAPKQERLIKLTAAQIAELKNDLSGKIAEYIRLEDEKKAADAEFNERLGELWDEIKEIQASINEG